ncbi:unnamed protein product [Mytilus coruscus]|uniref:Tyrosine-protein phosphatase domain-containing protein n=1 Tax=Mytilus coruscus TaxID=42192 RepID=A0A6J8B4Z5_MYTCO|nr:unnamed protein product [Mytilus coruscus]
MNILGPLKHTFTDFWAMIWQNNIRKIIMLTNLMEVAKTKEKRNIIQYHFTAWPDHGTPDPLYLVLFHKHVISDHSDVESGKLLVHCSLICDESFTIKGKCTFYKMQKLRSPSMENQKYTFISPENMKKNRNKSVIPSDNNRLFLTTYDKGRTDYINAVQAPDEKIKEIVIYCAVCSGYPKPNVLCKLVNMISTRVSMSHDAVTVVSGDGAKNCGLFCTFANAVSSMTIDDNADIFQLARLLQLRRPEFLLIW